MTFDELLALVSSTNGLPLRTDSRFVQPGDIFIAVGGSVYDGHDFIEAAVAKGAKFILCERVVTKNRPEGYETIIVGDSARAAAYLAQAAHGSPASKLINLAVTGTNGKTTVAFLVRSCIQSAGEKCGLIGTVVYDSGQSSSPAPLTTPDSLVIAKEQEQMLKAGAKYMVIEASSHGLIQNRLAGIDFKAAAFTNLTGDHLDYHQTYDNYLDAKAILFRSLATDAVAVLNKQSPASTKIAEQTKARIFWYAVNAPADITAHIESADITGTNFTLEYAGRKQKVKTSLAGLYNISNSLAAAGLCLAAGLDLEIVAAGLSALKSVPGRLERIEQAGVSVLIDYAHTDDALKNVLATLKPLCRGNLTVVFGCGGDRDKTKRPRMAMAVEEFADFVVVTSDNPRTENPQAIIEDVIAGFTGLGKNIIIEADRKKAIELAISGAGENDIVLIAGKGHETQQIIGRERFDFSDKQIAQLCLGKRK